MGWGGGRLAGGRVERSGRVVVRARWFMSLHFVLCMYVLYEWSFEGPLYNNRRLSFAL